MCHVNEELNKKDSDLVLETLKKSLEEKEEKQISYLEIFDFAKKYIDW